MKSYSMIVFENIVEALKRDFPIYRFLICKGLFERYIAVEIHGKIRFTIWVDKNSENKELFDETYFSNPGWLNMRFKTRLFHRSKHQYIWRRDYHRIIMEEIELRLEKRKAIRKRLEESPKNIHIT